MIASMRIVQVISALIPRLRFYFIHFCRMKNQQEQSVLDKVD